MKVQTLITVQSKDQAGIRWDTPFMGRTLLETVLQTTKSNPVNDAVILATDCDNLLRRKAVGGVQPREMPPKMRAYNFNYLGSSMGRITMETNCYKAVGADGEIVFHVDWRLPLLSTRCLERMYHTLLDSPTLPARVVPMQIEDPGLYIRQNGGNRLFPVWHAAGMDRQCMPQLFRPAPACVSYIARLIHGIPFVRGIERPGSELLFTDTPYKLELAAYIKRRVEHDRPPRGCVSTASSLIDSEKVAN